MNMIKREITMAKIKSIEEKAKAYDEVVERAKRVLLDCTPEEQKVVEYIFPELKEESEDERIRKAILWCIDTIQGELGINKPEGVSISELKSWLGKQGEQKPTEVRTTGYWSVQDIEQKSADKVESKFKVGDWIICCDYEPIQIINIKHRMYYWSNGDIRPIEMVDSNPNIRLWTIKDAKDGDILLSPSTPEGDKECPFIFKEIDKNGIVRFYAALLQSESLKIADGITNVIGYANAGYHIPATKEQREQLEKAITDAGFMWDAEKKELKKIEQKPAWSEEDENLFRCAIDAVKQESKVRTDGCLDEEVGGMVIDWLESFKERIKGE